MQHWSSRSRDAGRSHSTGRLQNVGRKTEPNARSLNGLDLPSRRTIGGELEVLTSMSHQYFTKKKK